jgi:type II secretory pathway predicted ATPase ExeA
VGLLTGEVGAGKSTAARVFTATLNPNLHKVLYLHFSCGTALEQLPLLLNFNMDSARYLTLLLVGQPLLRRTLSLQMHEALRQRIGTHYHLEGLTREELDAYLLQQLKAAGVTQSLFDDTACQGLYQATKGIPRKVNKLAMTALRLAAQRKAQRVDEAVLLDATAEALL